MPFAKKSTRGSPVSVIKFLPAPKFGAIFFCINCFACDIIQRKIFRQGLIDLEVEIRGATPADAPALLEIYAYYVEQTAVSFETVTPTAEEFAARIANTLKNYPYFVAEIYGKIRGYAYAESFVGREAYRFSAELTIYLDKNFRGKGLGTKLYSALEQNLRERGIKNLYACIGFPEVEDEFLTLASVNFHARRGFKICGKFTNCGFKFNRWYSMVWMEKILERS